MRRVLLAHACVLLTHLAFSQTFEMAPSWTGIPESDPRSTLTLVVQIRNNSPDTRSVGIDVDLPEGWRRVVPDLPVAAGSGASVPRFVSIFIPQEAVAGGYLLPLRAVDRETGTILATLEAEVRVRTRLELRIDGLDGSTHVLAGELIVLPVRVANLSNTTLAVELTLESRSFYAANFVEVPDGRLTLAPNESVRVVAQVRTPAVVSRVEDYGVEVVATGNPAAVGDTSGQVVTDTYRATVEIIPVISEERPPYRTLPARVRGATDHEFNPGWDGDLSLNLQGGGSLDEAGLQKLEFLIAPTIDLDIPSADVTDDRYRLNYSGPLVDVMLGDNTHNVSPLLGSRVAGRGILARIRPQQFTVAGLYSFDPEAGPANSTVALMSEFRVPDPITVSGDRYRTSVNAISQPGNNLVVGNHHQVWIGDAGFVEAEAAVGRSSDSSLVWGGFSGASWTLGVVRMMGKARLVSPHFPRGTADQLLASGSVDTHLSPINFDLSANSYYQQDNLSRADSSAASRTLGTGLNGSLLLPAAAANIVAGWRLRLLRDMMPGETFRQRDNTFTTTARFPLGNKRFVADARLNVNRDLLSGEWLLAPRINLAMKHTASAQVTYGGNFTMSALRGSAVPTDREMEAEVSTVQEWGPVAAEGRGGVGFESRNGSVQQVSAFLAVGTDVTVHGEHTIAVDGQVDARVPVAAGPAAIVFSGGFSVAYEAPLEIPIRRERGFGSVKGTAFDSTTRQPEDAIVVRVADRAVVTGEQGTFRLSSLLPGEYFLEVDTSRAGRGYIPDLPPPIKVSIVANETTAVQLPIVRAATITGSVDLYEPVKTHDGLLGSVLNDEGTEYSEDELRFVGGLQSAVMVAAREDEVRRVLTDAQGRFVFSDLRPGRWVVRVGRAQIPRYYQLVTEQFEVLLGPGGRENLAFSLHPLRRPLVVIPANVAPLVVTTERPGPGPTPRSEPESEAGPESAPAQSADERVSLVEERYARESINSPRMLGLPWGESPEGVEAVLAGRIGALQADGAPLAGVPDGGMPLRKFAASGTVHMGLSGSIGLTFLDPYGDGSRLFLAGVAVRISGAENAMSAADLRGLLHDLLALFAARWKVESMLASIDGSLEVSRARVGGIDISFAVDSAEETVIMEYRDDWYDESGANAGGD